MEMPLISVIVPVYKVEPYLDRCVRSIVEQTYRNLEILLIDDGSPDRSGAMCDAWAEKDSRIRVIHKENGGGGQARNVGLDNARGEWIAFVDSDDFLSPDMYQHLSSLLEDGADIAECGFVSTFTDQADFGERLEGFTVYTPREAMSLHIRDTAFRQVIWNKLYRRQVIDGVRFPEGTKIDDEFFTYRVLGNAGKLARSLRVCYAYRQQADSVMHGAYSLKRLEGLTAKQQRLAYLQARMPQLAEEGARNLFFSGMYAMQMSLIYLSGEDLEAARGIVKRILSGIPPLSTGKGCRWDEKMWICLANRSFEGTCRLRNLLFERDELRNRRKGTQVKNHGL